MAYDLIDIRHLDPQNYSEYFIDANVWIAQLQSQNFVANLRFSPYLDFFEGIISLNIETNPKALKLIKVKPKIIVTSLLLSEIFNGYLRQVAMKVYYSVEATKAGCHTEEDINKYTRKFDFKKDYRPTSDFTTQLKKLKSDFKAYKDYIEFRDDRFNDIGPITVIDSISNQSDFNDFYYYYSLEVDQVPIVTDDKDFIFQDIPIITANKTLLKIK